MCLWGRVHSGPCNGLQKGGFIIERLNELRDLEAGLLEIVCKDVEIEPQMLHLK